MTPLRCRPASALATLLATVLPAEASLGESSGGEVQAVDVEVVYKGDVWRNTTGGLRTGSAYIDYLDLSITVDGEAAFGIAGLELFANGLYNNGGRLSEELIGDAMVVSNIDSPYAVRFYQAWVDWRPGGNGPLSLRAGFYDLNSEFDASELRGMFVHSTHGVGQDLAQVGPRGPSIFPSTGLALRVAWDASSAWRLQFAAIDGAPAEPDGSPRERLHLDSDEGALLVGEAWYRSARVVKAAIGAWHHTAEFADVLDPDASRSRNDNSGLYGLMDVRLQGMETDAAPGVSAFARMGAAEGRINDFDLYLGAGVRARGLWAGRPADELGLAIAIGRVSGAARRVAEAAEDPRDRHETSVELTWRAPVTDWLTLQPDVQYILNPGTYRSARDALVIGLRFEVTHAW
jgi:porin